MTEKRTRIPFRCPSCGNSSDRAIRVGGLLSQEFRCASCGAHAIARNYHVFSALFGLLIVALTAALLAVLDFFLGTKVRFEYFLVAVAVVVVSLIWLSAARYWRLVIRWTKVGGGG